MRSGPSGRRHRAHIPVITQRRFESCLRYSSFARYETIYSRRLEYGLE